jgi:hypothetical protein
VFCVVVFAVLLTPPSTQHLSIWCIDHFVLPLVFAIFLDWAIAYLAFRKRAMPLGSAEFESACQPDRLAQCNSRCVQISKTPLLEKTRKKISTSRRP